MIGLKPLSQILTSVQFTTLSGGRRLAVMDAENWEELIEWLMDLEDRRIIQQSQERLQSGPEASGALRLETVLDEL